MCSLNIEFRGQKTFFGNSVLRGPISNENISLVCTLDAQYHQIAIGFIV